MSRIVGLMAVLAVAMIVALLVQTSEAVSGSPHCPAAGILPGSVSVSSTNDGAGQLSAHKVKFQLCGGIGGPEVTDIDGNIIGPPDKIGLLWQGFSLDDPVNSGVALSITGGNRWWPVTTDASRGNYEGVAVEFTPEQLGWLEQVAGLGPPLTLEFTIPLAAGMRNPDDPGDYRWDVALYKVLRNSCRPNPGDVTTTITAPYLPGEVQLFPNSGGPGIAVTIIGQALEPFSPVQSIKAGSLDITPSHRVLSDGLGDFEMEITFPGLDSGPQLIEVHVGETTLVAEFLLTEGSIGGPVYWYWTGDLVEKLSDNFVVIFHFNKYTECWTLYDPEIPDESDLTHLITGETYWLLVKEPQEVILNRETRNLTCTPDGNCWNRIVW